MRLLPLPNTQKHPTPPMLCSLNVQIFQILTGTLPVHLHPCPNHTACPGSGYIAVLVTPIQSLVLTQEALSSRHFSNILHEACKATNLLDRRFTQHHFCIGVAAGAADISIPEETIHKMGHWSFCVFIRYAKHQINLFH